MMSFSGGSAADAQAFNDKRTRQALYGKYGKGGILRERIRAKSLSDIAGRGMTAKDRADIELKKRELDIKERDPFLNPPLITGNEGQGEIATLPHTGEPLAAPALLGGEQFQPPAAPALRDAAPAARRSGGGGITVPPLREGERRDPRMAPPGTYSAPGEYDPGLGARIREQIEGARANERFTPPAEQTPYGGDYDTPGGGGPDYEAESYKPPLREVAQTARKPEVSVAEIAKALKAASARPGKTRASSAESTKEKGLAWLSKLIEGLWPKGQPHDLLYR